MMVGPRTVDPQKWFCTLAASTVKLVAAIMVVEVVWLVWLVTVEVRLRSEIRRRSSDGRIRLLEVNLDSSTESKISLDI